MNLGWLALREGSADEGFRFLGEGLALTAELGSWVASAIAYLAVGAALRGDATGAALLRGAAERQRETVGEPPISEFRDGSLDRHLAAARALAGPEAWGEAFARGKEMTLEEATRYALEFADSAARSDAAATRVSSNLLERTAATAGDEHQPAATVVVPALR